MGIRMALIQLFGLNAVARAEERGRTQVKDAVGTILAASGQDLKELAAKAGAQAASFTSRADSLEAEVASLVAQVGKKTMEANENRSSADKIASALTTMMG